MILSLTARQEHKIHFSSSSLSDCCDREDMKRETAVPFSALLPTSGWLISGEGSVLVGLSFLVFTMRIIALFPSAGRGGDRVLRMLAVPGDLTVNVTRC